jgi:hypothetical protein
LLQPYIGYVLERSGSVQGMYSVQGYKNAMMVFFICGFLSFISSLFIKETGSGLYKKP